jgi:hypothetical protein
MQENTIDFIFFIFGTILGALTSIIHFFSAFIFTRTDFKHQKIFRYIAANSAVDGCLFILAIIYPSSVYFRNYFTNLSILYFLQCFDYYFIICFGATLKRLSENLSISIAFYRLIELSRYRQLSKRINFIFVLLILVILSLIMTSHIYIWNKIVLSENGTSYERQINHISLFGYNFISIAIIFGNTMSILNIIIIFMTNLYIVILLKKLYSNRRHLLRLNTTQAQRLLSRNQSETTITCNDLLKIINKEIRISLLVGSISTIFALNMFMKLFSMYVRFFYEMNSIQQKHGLFLNHFLVCILNLLHFLCYYYFCSDFRKTFTLFFFK